MNSAPNTNEIPAENDNNVQPEDDDHTAAPPPSDSISYQHLMLPVSVLKSRFLKLQKPLKLILSRYAFLRDAIVNVNDHFTTNPDSTSGAGLLLAEIQEVHSVYENYFGKLKQLRSELDQCITTFSTNAEQLWAKLMALAKINEPQCRIVLFCLNKTISEHGCLENAVDESYKNCREILQLSCKYMKSLEEKVQKEAASNVAANKDGN